MSQVRGVADLGIFPVLGQPNLNIKVDRDKAARYGLNSGDVNTVVQAAMGGAVATEVLEGDRQFDLVVRYTPEYRDSIEKIRNIKVGYQTLQRRECLYPLERTGDDHPGYGRVLDLSRKHAALHPRQIQRARSRPGQHGGGSAEADRQKRKLPTGYRLVWAGEFGDLQEAKKRLEVIVPISLVLILGLLYSLFNNVRDCILALAGIPVAVAGGILALYVSGLHFSISAAIGFVSLFGVSVMDGILMITFYNHDTGAGLCAAGGHVPGRHPPACGPC